jgi:hypothetical protein
MIFAVLGLLYRYINNDIELSDIIEINDDKKNILRENSFTYNSFISNYINDDYEKVLEELITSIVSMLSQSYKEYKHTHHNVTSVSNYFKADTKYIENIITFLGKVLRNSYTEVRLSGPAKILKRK